MMLAISILHIHKSFVLSLSITYRASKNVFHMVNESEGQLLVPAS